MSAIADEVFEPAGRSSRLIAQTIDSLLALPAVLLVLVGVIPAIAGGVLLMNGVDSGAAERVAGGGGGGGLSAASTACIVGGIGLAVALTLYQWYLLATAAQTIGKRVCGLRIVEAESLEQATFMRAVAARVWGFSLLCMVPYLGALVGTFDLLPIFFAERRCLHDYIAGTRVYRVRARTQIENVATAVAVGGVAAVLTLSVVEARAFADRFAALAKELPSAPVPSLPSLPPLPSLPAPGTAPAPPPKPYDPISDGIWVYTDERGTPTIVQGLGNVPPRFRKKAVLK